MTLLSPRSLAAALVTTSVLLLPACGSRDCTLVGCANEPVSVVLLSPNWMPLEPAVYGLVFKLDGSGFAATCTVSDGEQSCVPVEGLAADFDVAVFVTTNNQIRINVTADDSALLPEDFQVEVSVGGSLVTEESGSFEYDEFRPNGPDCAPTCRNSDGAFVFVEL